MNIDFTGALFTLRIKFKYKTQCKEGASDVNIF